MIKKILRVTSSLPGFCFLLWLALPMMRGNETMVMVSIVLMIVSVIVYVSGCIAAYRYKAFKSISEIFGTKRDFLYEFFIALVGLIVHYSVGYYDASTWWLILIAAALGLLERPKVPSVQKSAAK